MVNLFYLLCFVTIASGCLNITINWQSSILCCRNGSYSQLFGETIAFSEKLPQICKQNDMPKLQIEAPKDYTRNGIIGFFVLILAICGFVGYKYGIYRCKRANMQITIHQHSSPNQEICETSV